MAYTGRYPRFMLSSSLDDVNSLKTQDERDERMDTWYTKDKDNDILRRTLLYWMTASADWSANKEEVYQTYLVHGLESEFSGSLGL
jgi:hypothetical protein